MIAMRLGFAPKDLERDVRTLSGGERGRLALGVVLAGEPEVLFLDEPTNHLDLETIEWLATYLTGWRGAVLVVSHDRAFLNAVATDIMHFHKKQIKYYPGNFDAFQQARADRLQKMENIQETIDKKVKHMEQTVSRMQQQLKSKKGGKLKNTTQGKLGATIAARKGKLERFGMEKTEDGRKYKIQEQAFGRLGSIYNNGGGWVNRKMTRGRVTEAPDPSVKFVFPDVEELGAYGNVLQLNRVSFAYPGAANNALTEVSMNMSLKSRVGILGRNGAGKSTLLHLLMGEFLPKTGERHQHHNLKLAFISQHHQIGVPSGASCLQHMQGLFPRFTETQIRAQLGRYGLHGHLALQKYETLSGGQQSRLMFAVATMSHPHVLVLDEPTNHLDYETIEALSDALQDFQGALILASHNQAVLREVCTEFWEVKNGTVTQLDCSFDDYIEKITKKLEG